MPTPSRNTVWRRINTQTADLKAIYRHMGDSSPLSWPAKVRDLSATAVRLIVPRPVQPGKFLALRLYSPRQAAPISRQVLVVGSQCHESNWTLVGMFIDPLSDDEWHVLVDEEEIGAAVMQQ